MIRCIYKGLKLKQEADEKLASYAKALADYEEALAQAKESYRESSKAYAYEYAANNAAFQEMVRTSRAEFVRCRDALKRLTVDAAESRKLR